MSEEILINISPTESRVAVVENGVLEEIQIERLQHRGLVGNIYRGLVLRVLPGIQAAFIDIGLSRSAFIQAADIVTGPQAPEHSCISQLIQEQQTLVVQVLKDPIGTKGARLTTALSIPSRYLVCTPTTSHVGVSLRIDDEEERQRLKDIVMDYLVSRGEGELGFIVRTVAEGIATQELIADIRYLTVLWQELSQLLQNNQVPALIYEDLSLPMRTLRDLVHSQVRRVRIDSRETFHKALDFVQRFMPEYSVLLEHYSGERPIFDLYGVEEDLQKALARRVVLKSGGYLIIDPTEAMTTIDVNTGAFLGARTLEDTVFKTNLEAAVAIARQIRVRNLAGIIIIDFIDMQDTDHQQQVLLTLERQLVRDHAKTQVLGMSELGLVQMTRKRTRENLEQMLCEPCTSCQGRGKLKTAETICYEIFRDILRQARAYHIGGLRVLASQAVISRLMEEESANLADLETFIGRTISVQVEPLFGIEHYNVTLL